MQTDRYTKVVLTLISLTLLVLCVNSIKPIGTVQAAPQESPRNWTYGFLETVITPYSENGTQLKFKRTCLDFAGNEFPCSSFKDVLHQVSKAGAELITVKTEQREGNTTEIMYIFKF